MKRGWGRGVYILVAVVMSMFVLLAGCDLRGLEILLQEEKEKLEAYVSQAEKNATEKHGFKDHENDEFMRATAPESRNNYDSDQIAEAYISAVQRAGENYPYFNDTSYGILYDLDGDKVLELVLSHMAMMDMPYGYEAPCFVYSVYDYENGVLQTLAEDEFLAVEAGGNSGYAGVVIHDGEPMLLTYTAGGETGYGGEMSYKHVVRDVRSLEEIYTLRIVEKMGTEKEYYCGGNSCAENEFIQGAAGVTYLEFKDGKLIYNFETIPLEELEKDMNKLISGN